MPFRATLKVLLPSLWCVATVVLLSFLNIEAIGFCGKGRPLMLFSDLWLLEADPAVDAAAAPSLIVIFTPVFTFVSTLMLKLNGSMLIWKTSDLEMVSFGVVPPRTPILTSVVFREALFDLVAWEVRSLDDLIGPGGWVTLFVGDCVGEGPEGLGILTFTFTSRLLWYLKCAWSAEKSTSNSEATLAASPKLLKTEGNCW